MIYRRVDLSSIDRIKNFSHFPVDENGLKRACNIRKEYQRSFVTTCLFFCLLNFARESIMIQVLIQKEHDPKNMFACCGYKLVISTLTPLFLSTYLCSQTLACVTCCVLEPTKTHPHFGRSLKCRVFCSWRLIKKKWVGRNKYPKCWISPTFFHTMN